MVLGYTPVIVKLCLEAHTALESFIMNNKLK